MRRNSFRLPQNIKKSERTGECELLPILTQSILLKAHRTQLREYAVRISRERYELRQEILSKGFESAKDISQK
jgi:hypothetical protein